MICNLYRTGFPAPKSKTEHITIPKNTAVFYTLKRKRGSAEIVPSLDIPMQRTSFDFYLGFL
jgi:hypothetical protein